MSELVKSGATRLSVWVGATLVTRATPAINGGLLEGTAALQGALAAAADLTMANPAIAAGGAGVVSTAVGCYLAYQHFDDIKAAAHRLADAMKRGLFELTATPEKRLHCANMRLQVLQDAYKSACDLVRIEVQNYKDEQTEEMRTAVQEARDQRKQARGALAEVKHQVGILVRRVASG